MVLENKHGKGAFLRKVASSALSLAMAAGLVGGSPLTAMAASGGVVSDNPPTQEDADAGGGDLGTISAQFSVNGLKQDGTGRYVDGGDTLEYDVTIRNNLQGNLSDIDITFHAPSGTTPNEGARLDYRLDDFLSTEFGQDGKSLRFTVPVTVGYGVSEIGPATVTASWTLDGVRTEGQVGSSKTSYPVHAQEDPNPAESGRVGVSGTVSPDRVEAGGTVRYEVKVGSLEGYRGVADVYVELPEGFTMEGWDVPGRVGNVKDETSTMLAYRIPDLLPDNEVVIYVDARVPADYTEDRSCVAKAYAEFDGGNRTGDVEMPVTVGAAPEVPVGPISSDDALFFADSSTVGDSDRAQEVTVSPGDSLKLQMLSCFTSEAEGVSGASDVELVLEVPHNKVSVTDSRMTGYGDGSSFGRAMVGEDRHVFRMGDVPLGQLIGVELEISVSEEAVSDAVVIGGHVAWKEGDAAKRGPDMYVRLYTDDGIDHVNKEPMVSVAWRDTKDTSDRMYRAGDALPVHVSVANNDSEVPLHDVKVCLPVIEGADLSASGFERETLNGKDMMVYSMELLEAASSKEFDVVYTAKEGNDAADSLYVYASMAYSNWMEGSDMEGMSGRVLSNGMTAIREVPDAGSLALTLTQDDTADDITVSAGQRVAYKATVYNNGSTDIRNVNVMGKLPDGLTFVKADNTKTVCDNGDITFGSVDLKAGESASVGFTVDLPKDKDTGVYSMSMEASGDDIAKVSSNFVTMTVGKGDVRLDLWQRKDGMEESTKSEMNVNAGEGFSYVYVITNPGTAPIAEVDVGMTVPSTLGVTKDLPDLVSVNGNAMLWRVYGLEPGESRRMELKVTAPSKANASVTSTSLAKTTIQASAKFAWRDTASKAYRGESNTVSTVVAQTLIGDAATTGGNTGNHTGNASGSNGGNGNGTGTGNGSAQSKKVNNTGLDVIVTSTATNGHMMAYQGSETVQVQARYTKLANGVHYVGTVGLVNASGGVVKQKDGTDATAHVDFYANGTSGDIMTVNFTVDGKAFVGQSVYGAMDVTPDGDSSRKISYHGEGFEQSTLRSAKVTGAAMMNPTVSTANNASASASVAYENVVAGESYRMVAALMDRGTGKPLTKADGKAVMGQADFKAEKNDGSVDVPIEFGADDVDGKDLAVYVTLYDRDGKVVLASEQDMNRNKASGSALANGGTLYATAKTGLDEDGGFGALVLLLSVVCAIGVAGCLWARREHGVSE